MFYYYLVYLCVEGYGFRILLCIRDVSVDVGFEMKLNEKICDMTQQFLLCYLQRKNINEIVFNSLRLLNFYRTFLFCDNLFIKNGDSDLRGMFSYALAA